MSAWDRMFDSYSNLAPQKRHLNFISLKSWIHWVIEQKNNFYLVFDEKGCLKQNRCALLDLVLYNKPAAWSTCNTSVSYYIKYYISYITSQLCFRIRALIYADMAAYKYQRDRHNPLYKALRNRPIEISWCLIPLLRSRSIAPMQDVRWLEFRKRLEKFFMISQKREVNLNSVGFELFIWTKQFLYWDRLLR